MTILVDMDDVLENLLEVWVSTLNARHNLSVDKEDITEWEMTRSFPSLTNEQIFEPLHEEEFWKRTTPIDGSQKYLKMLQDEGHEIFVVTATHYKTVDMKMENVINKYFPFIPYHNVIITHSKQMIKGDVLVDDYIPNLLGGEYVGILFDAPYNRGVSDAILSPLNVKRVKSWKEIYEEIQIIQKHRR